jgi:signal peptidase I
MTNYEAVDRRTDEPVVSEPAGADGAAPKRPRKQSRGGGVGRFLRDVAIILVAAIVISFLIKTFLIRSFYIPSESMEATLIKNDRIIVNELVPDVTPIERGDVVVFKDPGGWLTPVAVPEQNPVVGFFDWLLSFVGLTAPDSNDHLIKRVIGLPGDVVACCNEFGQMTVNGVPLDEPYVIERRPWNVADAQLGPHEFYVIGDNRGMPAHLHDFGRAARSRIAGRVLTR